MKINKQTLYLVDAKGILSYMTPSSRETISEKQIKILIETTIEVGF